MILLFLIFNRMFGTNISNNNHAKCKFMGSSNRKKISEALGRKVRSIHVQAQENCSDFVLEGKNSIFSVHFFWAFIYFARSYVILCIFLFEGFAIDVKFCMEYCVLGMIHAQIKRKWSKITLWWQWFCMLESVGSTMHGYKSRIAQQQKIAQMKE